MNDDEHKTQEAEGAPPPAAQNGNDGLAVLDARVTQIEAAVVQIADQVSQLVAATGLDPLLAEVTAPPAAKEAARATLLRTKGPHTRESVREAIHAEITRAAAILGTAAGVVGFGAGPDPAAPEDHVAALRESLAARGANPAALDAALRLRLGD